MGVEADKQLKPVRLRLGITDGTNTELLAGEVQQGTEVVTGVVLPASARPAAAAAAIRSSRAAARAGRVRRRRGGDEDDERATRHLGQEPRQDLRGRRGRGAGASRRQSRCRARRVPGRHRHVRIGQVDVHAHRRVSRPADVGPVLSRRRRRLAHVEGPAGGRAQQEDRLRVPGLQPAVADLGARQRRAAAAVRRRRAENRGPPQARDGHADGGRPRQSRRPPPESAVGRAAAARRDRAGARRTTRRFCSPTSRRATSTRKPASR